MHSNNSWARGFMALFAIVLAMGLALAACPAEAAPFLYVTNVNDNTVSVIDTATNTVVGLPIAVGSGPIGVAVTPDGTKVYVANNGSANVSVIHTATKDPASKSVVKTVPVGNFPTGVAVTPDGTKVYVANMTDNTVSVIHRPGNTVVATIPVGNAPFGVAITPDGTQAYVTNAVDNTVSVINTATNLGGYQSRWGLTPIGSPSPRMGHRPTSRMETPTMFR
jgi:YVTN family beta-propeller protein